HADRPDREDTGAMSYTLTGTRVATVDAEQAYAPDSGPYSKIVHPAKDEKNGQWRIDAVPQGVVMGRSDFQRNYMSVNKYCFASNNAETKGTDLPMAVGDPVYVRRKV